VNDNLATQPATLSNCDVEPIHIPGTIQAIGCLLACDPDSFVIRHASTNTEDLLGLGAGSVIGASLDDVLGREIGHEVRNSLARSPDPSRPGLLFRQNASGGRAFDIVAHMHDGRVIIELKPAAPQSDPASLELARTIIRRLGAETRLSQLLRNAPRLLFGALKYDRVMVYRFAENGAGQVVAETKRADLESFSGQWFPASDIPAQARALYLRNTIRVVSDASGETVPILPVTDADGRPIDLSYAHLRSVSPIHCEYLRNMGVAASMSVSIIVEGKLWGLIACHHYSPRALSLAERMNIELIGDCFSMQVESLISRELLQAAAKVRAALGDILLRIVDEPRPDLLLRARIDDMAKLIPSDGAALWLEGEAERSGRTPADDILQQVARLAESEAPGQVWATDRLSTRLEGPMPGGPAGVLAIPLSKAAGDYLFYFRKEVVETIEWGGDPNKAYTTGPNGDRLTPRVSFAIWKEEVRGQSQPWTAQVLEAAEGIRIALMEITLRQTALLQAERQQAEVRQRRLNDELNHRVKNILALIRSLLRQSKDDGRSLADYVSTLEGRIMSLAKAHDQVWHGSEGGHLKSLVETELSPYHGRGAVIELQGPPVVLDARAFSVVALVVHELATNAAKYGSISSDHGRLDIAWRLNDSGDCVIEWTESGGPPVTPPKRKGFGSTLIDRSIPFDLQGEVDLAYRPEGLRASIRIPAPFVSVAEAAPASAASPAQRKAPRVSLAGLNMLVVEDQFVVALEMEDLLLKLGAETVEVAATPANALAAIRRQKPDVALLDVNLGGSSSIEVARTLIGAGVPVLFTTGYADNAHIPPELQAVPVLRKPYTSALLSAALERLLRGRAV
jgi:light-regulated signal transduction histidine kinase (bacteriophytochrome)